MIWIVLEPHAEQQFLNRSRVQESAMGGFLIYVQKLTMDSAHDDKVLNEVQ